MQHRRRGNIVRRRKWPLQQRRLALHHTQAVERNYRTSSADADVSIMGRSQARAHAWAADADWACACAFACRVRFGPPREFVCLRFVFRHFGFPPVVVFPPAVAFAAAVLFAAVVLFAALCWRFVPIVLRLWAE